MISYYLIIAKLNSQLYSIQQYSNENKIWAPQECLLALKHELIDWGSICNT